MMPVNLFVVRHGESIGNLAKRMSEKGDHTLLERLHGTHTAHWPLTKNGIEQAKLAGAFLNQLRIEQRIYFDRTYVSSYARAMQTADNLNLTPSEWILDSRITERDWGDLDSLTESERQDRFGEALKMRTVEPYFWSPPNGEAFKLLNLFIRDFIDSAHRANSENMVVCCHGEVAKAFRIVNVQMTPMEYAEMEFSKDPLRRIHNCQIDHYTRRNPVTYQLEGRLQWLQVYRPAEGQGIAIPWQHLPRRRFSDGDLREMASKLSAQFADLDI